MYLHCGQADFISLGDIADGQYGFSNLDAHSPSPLGNEVSSRLKYTNLLSNKLGDKYRRAK